MKSITRTLALMSAMALFLAAAPTLRAQMHGGGGGQRGMGTPGSGQQGQMGGRQGQMGGQQGQMGQPGQMGGHRGEMGEMQEQMRQLMQATGEQRGNYENCIQSADRIRHQARDMGQSAQGPNFDADKARSQRDQMRQEVLTMQHRHDQFSQGLIREQRAQLQDQMRRMDQARNRLHSRLDDMDRELNRPNPDSKRVAQHSREIDQAMKDWEKQYHRIGALMSIKP